MELTQTQFSEIISNYTSSSEGFVTLQSLIMNSLMLHERDLFIKVTTGEPVQRFSSSSLV
jgi:putative transposase